MTLISASNGQWGFLKGNTLQVRGTGRTFLDIAQSKDGKIFAVTGSSLYRLSRSGQSSFVGSLGVDSMNALGFDAKGNLFGAAGQGFYRINQGTGRATLVRQIPGFSSSGDIAFDASRKQFFATSRSLGSLSDVLVSITPKGKARRVGNIGFRDVYGLRFDRGTMVGYTVRNQEISINLVSGAGRFRRIVRVGGSATYGAA